MTTRLVFLVLAILAMTGVATAHDPPACLRPGMGGAMIYTVGLCQGYCGEHYFPLDGHCRAENMRPDDRRSYDDHNDNRRSRGRRGYGDRDRNDSDLETGLKVGERIVRKVLDNAARRREAEAAERIARAQVVIREEQRPEEPEIQQEGTGDDCRTLVNYTAQKLSIRIDGDKVRLEPGEKKAKNYCSDEITSVLGVGRVGTSVDGHEVIYEDYPVHVEIQKGKPYERMVFFEKEVAK